MGLLDNFEGISDLPKLAMSFGVLLFMIMIDFYWGQFIMSFANGLAGEQAILIKLMITFTLLFGTFVVPILILSGKVNPNPFNLIYGIITMLVGITIVLTILWIIEPIATLLLTGTEYLIIINALMMLAILFFGFINPIYAMIQDDRMDKVITKAVEGVV